MEERLSDWLSEQIQLFDSREGNTLSADDQRARSVLEQMAEELIEGKETFADGDLERIFSRLTGDSDPFYSIHRGEPEITEGEIDRVLTIRTLSGIREMTSRLMDLSKLQRVRVPSVQTETYVREAARSYVYGLYQASAVMSRAALEQALKEVLGRQGVEDHVPFKKLRKEASEKRILDNVTGPAARDFFKDASAVTHHKPTDPSAALDILDRARALIVQIYAAANQQSQTP